MADVEYLPISALQHILFCERQCALIHLEQIWTENRLTVQGDALHERVDKGDSEKRSDVIVARGLRICSQRHELTGIADRVDFFRCADSGCVLPGRRGMWRPVPVEYKRGRRKEGDWDKVQLCAQAICLEEMLGCQIVEGALFYWETRSRQAVLMTDELRETTLGTINRLRSLFKTGITPKPTPKPGCKSCSLIESCWPGRFDADKSVLYYESLFRPEDY